MYNNGWTRSSWIGKDSRFEGAPIRWNLFDEVVIIFTIFKSYILDRLWLSADIQSGHFQWKTAVVRQEHCFLPPFSSHLSMAKVNYRSLIYICMYVYYNYICNFSLVYISNGTIFLVCHTHTHIYIVIFPNLRVQNWMRFLGNRLKVVGATAETGHKYMEIAIYTR